MSRFVVLGLGCVLLSLSSASAQIPKKTDLPRFIKELSAKDAKVRINAATSIGDLGAIRAAYAKDGVEPLLKVLEKDDDAKCREAAAVALARIEADGDKTAPVLTERIKSDKDRAVVMASINAAGYVAGGTNDVMTPLKEAIKEVLDKAREEQAEAKKEEAAARADENKEKIKIAQGKGRVAGDTVRAAQEAIKRMGAK